MDEDENEDNDSEESEFTPYMDEADVRKKLAELKGPKPSLLTNDMVSRLRKRGNKDGKKVSIK